MSAPTYLPPIDGHCWIFDDASPAGAFEPTTAANDEVEGSAVAATLPQLGSLLRERHVALALPGGVDPEVLDEVLDDLQRDLAGCGQMPAEEAWRVVEEPLRELLRDGHLRCRFEPRPVAEEQALAPVEMQHLDCGTSIIDIRRLSGVGFERAQLHAFSDSDLPQSTTRVIFDLRGCPGGDDSWTWRWVERRINSLVPLGSAMSRTGPARAVDEWNQLVKLRHWLAGERLPSTPGWQRELMPGEHVRDALHRLRGTESGFVTEEFALEPAGDRVTFAAEVLVLVDGGTGSSGESTAFMLQEAFAARLIGRRTRGCIDFGNVLAFPVPGSGTAWQLPTHANRYPGSPVDLVGIPVDVELDESDIVRPAEELLPLLDLDHPRHHAH